MMDYDEWNADEPSCDICGDPDAQWVRKDGREVCDEHRDDGDPASFRRIRLTVGITIDEAAALCGVQPRTVRRWESYRGQWVPPADAVAVMGRVWESTADAVARIVGGDSVAAGDGDAGLRADGLARMVAAVNARR